MQARAFCKSVFCYTPLVILVGCVIWMTYILIQINRTASEFECMQRVFALYPTNPGADPAENKRQRNHLIQQIHLQCKVEVELEK